MHETNPEILDPAQPDEKVNCDFCDIKCDFYIDGQTVYGIWGNMCTGCHNREGVGLGKGKGQKYGYVDGRYYKLTG